MASIGGLLNTVIGPRTGRPDAPAPAVRGPLAPTPVRGEGIDIRLSPQARAALDALRGGFSAQPRPEPAPAPVRRLDIRV